MKNKFDEAIGLFWGASLFIGVLVGVTVGFKGNLRSDWGEAVLIGSCVFFIMGLISQGVITLMKKN